MTEFQKFSDTNPKPPSFPLILDGRPKKLFELEKMDQKFGDVLSNNLGPEADTTSSQSSSTL